VIDFDLEKGDAILYAGTNAFDMPEIRWNYAIQHVTFLVPNPFGISVRLAQWKGHILRCRAVDEKKTCRTNCWQGIPHDFLQWFRRLSPLSLTLAFALA
jgi:hypothetical protein